MTRGPDVTITTEEIDWQEETWTYAGIRLNVKGQRRHGWIDPDGSELLYQDTGRFVVGGLYTVLVDRSSAGTTRQSPVYTGERTDRDTISALYVQELAAETKLATTRRHSGDAAKDPLEDALRPLIKVAQQARTGAAKDALVAYVMRRLYEAW